MMMAQFTFSPGAVAVTTANGKQDVLEQLADRFVEAYGLARDDVIERIQERERLGSTGFGRGVAIPHARVEGLPKPVTALLRLEAPVDFDAADGLPVELVIGLLSPESAGVSHLHALAAISRMVRNEQVRDALLKAPDAEALFGLLTNAADRDAA